MAKINKVMVGESLVGDGNEVAHIDLIIGPRGSAAETAFCNALTNNKDGFTSLLAVRSARPWSRDCSSAAGRRANHTSRLRCTEKASIASR